MAAVLLTNYSLPLQFPKTKIEHSPDNPCFFTYFHHFFASHAFRPNGVTTFKQPAG